MHGLARSTAGGKRRPAGARPPSAAGSEYSVATYFAAFVALLLIAVLAAVGGLEYRAAASERAELERSAAQKARDITAEIDLNMVTRENLLTVLAGSYFAQLGLELLSPGRRRGQAARRHDRAARSSHQFRIFNTESPGPQLSGSAVPGATTGSKLLAVRKPAVWTFSRERM
jgi:hypothetical protein